MEQIKCYLTNSDQIFFKSLAVILFLLVVTSNLIAQSIPVARKFVVAQKHPLANDANSGSSSRPFKTISKAASLAQPGDTVIVHKGIYREWVAPARGGKEGAPITYMAAPGENVIIRGSEIYQGKWQKVQGHDGIFSTKIPPSFFKNGFDPFKIVFSEERGGGRQGQVFIDGKEFYEASQKLPVNENTKKGVVDTGKMDLLYKNPSTWCTPDGETIYLHLPEKSKPIQETLVEFSVRRHLFAPLRRCQDYINVKGFIFEHCANDASFPQVGAVSCRSGQHWTIEQNIVRNIKTIGIDFGAEDENPWLLPDILLQDRFLVSGHHDIFTLSERRIAGRNLILNNKVSNCGQCGLAGLFSDGSVIAGNIVERCGAVIPGFESGGIKVHGLMGGTIEANLVRDNESWGIWLDCGYIGSRVTRNIVLNNKISGIFFECSNGPGLIDNNIVACNRGDGIYTHDASGVNIANNLIFDNSNFGVYMCIATERLVPPYHYATGLFENEPSACSWQRNLNNIIVQNKEGAVNLPQKSKLVVDNFSDFNLFDKSYGGPLFVKNFRNGENYSEGKITDEALKAFMKSGDAGLSADKLVLWKKDKGVAFNLQQWTLNTGNDSHSLVADISVSIDLQTLKLAMTLDRSITSLKCVQPEFPRVRDFVKFARKIDKDFFEKPMPNNNWKAGTFQDIGPGKHLYHLWPVKYKYPAMPSKITPQPARDSEAFKPVARPAKG